MSQKCVDKTDTLDFPAPLDGALAVWLDNGEWRPGTDGALATWRGSDLESLVYSADAGETVFPAELDAVRYALDTRETRLPFGVADIGYAVVQAEPRVEASLGANGWLTLRLAHATGLWQLLEGGNLKVLRWEDVPRKLSRQITRAMREAACACCGEMPWSYADLERAFSDGTLRTEAAKSVFRALYPYGLAALPKETRILGLAYSSDRI